MDAYIEIDGKRAKLTEEQLKALGLEPEKKNPFEREGCRKYFFISGTGQICERYNNKNNESENHYSAGNFCTDIELMKQRALHETLNRLLWRYSMEHDGDEVNWGNTNLKHYIYCDYYDHKLTIGSTKGYQNIGNVYFATYKTAESAIKEIIEPFKAEHPEFKW